MNAPLLLVAGPTASGKSALALALAESLGGSIVNADSVQIYRDLPILTARPTLAEMARVPHFLYGDKPPDYAVSAANWADAARCAIETIRGQGRLPILCGGSGLYLKALLTGFADIPPVPDAIRQQAALRRLELGAAGFHAEIAGFDPALAARRPPADRQRLLRGWEVFHATGRALSDWQAETQAAPALGRVVSVILDPPRDWLYPRIDARFIDMIRAGALEEVQALAEGDPFWPIWKAHGSRELRAHLAGACTLAEAIAAGQSATRAYAKRQRTWFKHQIHADCLSHEKFSDEMIASIISFVRVAVDSRQNAP